jgi:hypothetical protein
VTTAATAPPPTYRARLQLEGLVLAGLGIAGSIALLAFDDHATDVPASTIGQLAIVAVLLAFFGPRSVRSAIAGAEPVAGPQSAGGGEPTPLWHLPLIVAMLATPLWLLGAPDAALRVTGGVVLVGLTQALVLAALVAADEQRTGRTFVRLPGSRILRGTKLGFWT